MSDRVRLGGFAAGYGKTWSDLSGLEGFAGANVTFALGGGHALRVGTLSFAPGVGWEWSNERWLARVELHTMGVITGGRAEVGARF